MTTKLQAVSTKAITPVKPSASLPVAVTKKPILPPPSKTPLASPVKPATVLPKTEGQPAKYSGVVTYEATNPEAQAKLNSFGSYQDYKEWVDKTLRPYLLPDGKIDLIAASVLGRQVMLQTGFTVVDTDKALKIVTVQNNIKPYTDEQGMVDLVAAMDAGVSRDDLVLVFDEAKVNEAYRLSSALSTLRGAGLVDSDGYIDLVGVAAASVWSPVAGVGQQLVDLGVISNQQLINARVLSRYRVGTSSNYDVNRAILEAIDTPSMVSKEQVCDAFGMTGDQFDILYTLETKYKTPEGYNLAQAMRDDVAFRNKLSANYQFMYNVFGEEAVKQAFETDRLLTRMGQLSIEQAIDAGIVTPAQVVTLGLFETEADAKRAVSVSAALSKIKGYGEVTPTGMTYNLVGIIQDKALSPGEVQLVFGPQSTDSAEVAKEKKETLKVARDIAHGKAGKVPAGLAQSLWWSVTPWKEELGVSYLDYVTNADGTKNYVKGVVAGEAIAGQIVGPFLLALIPGAILGTGAAIGGRAATVGVTLSRVAGTGITYGFAAMGAYGVYETATNWNQLSNAQRGFNLSVSALAMMPAFMALRRGVIRAELGDYRLKARQVTKSDVVASGKPSRSPVKTMTKVLKGQQSKPLSSLLSEGEGRYGKTTFSLMKKQYGQAVADSWKRMNQVRNTLLDAYIQRIDIERGFKPLSEKLRDVQWAGEKLTQPLRRSLGLDVGETIPTVREAARLKAINTNIRQLEAQLEGQTKRAFESLADAGTKLESKGKVSHLTRERLSAIDRDWATLEETFRNPGDVVLDTKALAEAITGKSDLASLKAEVVAAQKRLDAVRFKKHVSATTTFGDLAADLAEKQLRYKLAILGDMTAMQQMLADINTSLRTGRLPNGKPISEVQRFTLKMAADELAETIWAAAHRADPVIEAIYEDTPSGKKVVGYRTPEGLTSGGGGVAVAEPPVQTAPSVSLQTLTRQRTQAPVIAYAGIGSMRSPVFEKAVKPLVYDDIKKVVQPGELSLTTNVMLNAISIGMQNKLAGANQSQMANAIENALAQELATSTELSTELKLKLQTKLKVLVKTAVKVAVKVKPRPRWFPPFIPPTQGAPSSEEDMGVPKGAAGWKQGAFYWHIWPEGNELKKKATSQPVPGIPYKSGIGSAYDSLRKTHGDKLPKLMAMDMGIMDVYIQGDHREPKMKVRQDLQRRTRLGYVEGNPSMSRMK